MGTLSEEPSPKGFAMHLARQYEPGMNIVYDAQSRAVTVAFRGRLTKLQGLYASEEDGRTAAEAYCRRLGWKPPIPSAEQGRSLLSYRRAS